MTPPKRTYDFRIVGWQVFTPEEQERIYMQLLTSQSVEVSDVMRKLILEEWPELAHKLAPKRAPGSLGVAGVPRDRFLASPSQADCGKPNPIRRLVGGSFAITPHAFGSNFR
jgi:hypothetical protein